MSPLDWFVIVATGLGAYLILAIAVGKRLESDDD